MTNRKILVVDDDEVINEVISLYLEKERFQVIRAENGTEVMTLVKKEQPDLIILDILLPDSDGVEICRELRKFTEIPILFVSCKNDEMDKVLGLGVGGDDYITKPFSPKELVARVKAHLRRSQSVDLSEEKGEVLLYDTMKIDIMGRTVEVSGKDVSLTATEYELLCQLARHPNRVFSMEELYQLLWKADSNGEVKTITVHISNLRKKIEQKPTKPRFILTVRGGGYKFSGNARK
ncbi:response regulator transcription factor [Alkalihalobacillus sp. BA299]|uniref:response regulator transcription factor n=1 Tax=Alkalihalobacillus sp. BA299 TaxID=2815938 RepID=UPI001ADCBB55|nr:response regulator transcription factor [Alkalihalobacillus sp. BA299]